MTTARERHTDVLDTLLDADHQLAGTAMDDHHGIYQIAHQTAGRIAPLDSFYIALYDVDDNSLLFAYNFDGRLYDGPCHLPVGDGPTSWVIRNKVAFVLGTDNRDVQGSGVRFGNTDRTSESAVHVPMRVYRDGAEVVIGVLSAQSYNPGAYDETSVKCLQWLADRTAAALEREHAVADLQHQVAEANERASQRRRLALDMADGMVRMLADITREAEGLRATVRHEDPVLKREVEALCALCYRMQTEAHQLPLRPIDPSAQTGETLGKPLPRLTAREHEVLDLLVTGASAAGIAQRLDISVDTVKFHRKNLFRKMGVTSRVHAVKAALFARAQQDIP